LLSPQIRKKKKKNRKVGIKNKRRETEKKILSFTNILSRSEVREVLSVRLNIFKYIYDIIAENDIYKKKKDLENIKKVVAKFKGRINS